VAVSSPDQALAAARAKDATARAAQVVSTDPTTATGEFTDFLKTVAKNPALITGYSKVLKAAGYYKGKVTSKYNAALAKAFIDAEKDRALVAQATPISREDFYAQLEPTGTGGDGGPTVVTDITAYTPEAAKMLIQSVIKDTLGRNATDSEIKKYTSGLKKIQQQAASTTTYKTVGGKQTRVTTPGISEQQYLIDQVSGTDEGKANKALGFYETFMNALGGR
jgi:hypothetical protein